MTSEFNPSNCPVGKVNEKSIIYVGERLDMAIERLEEKMDDMKSDLTSHMNDGFSNLNEKLDKVDGRLTGLENNLDSRIELKFKQLHGGIILKLVGWVFGSLGAGVIITVVTRYILKALNL